VIIKAVKRDTRERSCSTVLYQKNFSDHLIKNYTGLSSLEALHKYKRTGSDQQQQVSMALLLQLAKTEKENWDDDFQLLKKRRLMQRISRLFPHSSPSHCMLNIHNYTIYFTSPQ